MSSKEVAALVEKLNSAPGKKLIADGYLYRFALIKKLDGEQTAAIVKRPENGHYKDYEIVCYTPDVKI